MERRLRPRHIITPIVVVAICVLARAVEPATNDDEARLLWYSILPPLLAVSFAIASGRIMFSLGASILIGGMLVRVPDGPTLPGEWFGGLAAAFGFIKTSATDPFNLQLLAFVVLIMAMISVMIVGGGMQGVILWLSRFVRGRRSAQLMTAMMGLALFIDDYANTMIVGSSMRAVTDKYKVSREKLAFIVDATSAPIAGLAVISTWVGYEVGLFGEISESLKLGQEGYSMLFDALPFRFYCILMIVFMVIGIATGGEFGPMARAEARARETGALSEHGATPMTSAAFTNARPDGEARILARSAVVPIAVLLAFLFGGIWIDGGGVSEMADRPLAFLSPGVWREVISASENSVLILAYGAGLGLLVALFFARFVARIPDRAMDTALGAGIRSSMLPVMILILAWSLKESCTALGTGEYLVAIVGDSIRPAYFPAVVFIIGALTSFATGTSYGTMAILIPIATPIAFHLEGGVYGPVTIITLAAVLDGSIFGDHCSPISDTTIMSSISSSCDHLHHVRTQLPYSLTIAAMALVFCYLPAGRGLHPAVSIGAAVAVIGVVLYALGRRGARRGDSDLQDRAL